MSVLDPLLTDLATETHLLRAAVADLSDQQWQAPTPAPGWTVRDTIGHLAWTDEAAIASATDKEAWDALVVTALEDIDHAVDEAAHRVGSDPNLLARWDAGCARLAEVLRAHEGKIGWFGPPMSPTSMATARFMETWAHGLDVREALGLPAVPTDRIRNVCHLGVRTRDFAFGTHNLPSPVEEFGVTLAAPSGDIWTWGPEEATQTVTGSAWDFARLVTQRIHRSDTDLVASGPDADRWLDIAQAFAGPPGEGRAAKGETTIEKERVL
ncbi:MAG: TIGR03084 family metal-binding protein [Nocardioides sp.]